jgi:hypothetical protein
MNSNRLKILGVGTGLALGVAIYFRLRLNKKDQKAEKLLTAVQSQIKPDSIGIISENAFDIHYEEEVKKKIKADLILLKTETAIDYAKQIHSAWSFWGDDEDKVYSVFRALRDKVQVSQVARAYQSIYNINLVDKMKSKLSKSEIGKVLQIVAPLPKYRILK